MSDLFGGGETKTKVQLPPQTPEEKALIYDQVALASKQLGAITAAGDFTTSLFQQFYPTLATEVNKFLPEGQQIQGQALDFASKQIGAQGDLLQSEVDAIKNGYNLTPDQAKLIDQGAQAAIDSGLSDLSKYRDDSLRQLTQETSQARGLRPEDTPIVDVGGRIVNESDRLAQQLITQVRGQAAQQKLDYPITVGNAQAARTQAQQTLGANTMNYVQNLLTQAFNNRLNLTSTTGQIGLGLAGIGPSPSTLGALSGERTAQATTTTTQPGMGFGSFLTGLGSAAGGVGGLLKGASSAGLFGNAASAAALVV